MFSIILVNCLLSVVCCCDVKYCSGSFPYVIIALFISMILLVRLSYILVNLIFRFFFILSFL
uniref:Uncharacterized protein n=1 Tax=Lepeophtheirus salmonis TaxID=72036 RepID=A0A0K2SXC8_LEPSM